MEEYRRHLILAEQKAQEDFDKALLTLSGGALGVSFAFVTNVVGSPPYEYFQILLGGWASFVFSLVVVVLSYYFSRQALRMAIREADSQTASQRPGGIFTFWTEAANVTGALSFFLGLILVGTFAVINV